MPQRIVSMLCRCTLFPLDLHTYVANQTREDTQGSIHHLESADIGRNPRQKGAVHWMAGYHTDRRMYDMSVRWSKKSRRVCLNQTFDSIMRNFKVDIRAGS